LNVAAVNGDTQSHVIHREAVSVMQLLLEVGGRACGRRNRLVRYGPLLPQRREVLDRDAFPGCHRGEASTCAPAPSPPGRHPSARPLSSPPPGSTVLELSWARRAGPSPGSRSTETPSVRPRGRLGRSRIGRRRTRRSAHTGFDDSYYQTV